MQIYILDKDDSEACGIEKILNGESDLTIKCFSDTSLFEKAAEESAPDIVLLDADLKGSLVIARNLSERKNRIRIVLMASSDAYAAEAFELGISGYIVKPVTKEKTDKQLLQVKPKKL